MMAPLAAVSPIVAATFAEASAVLGYDLWQLCQQGPEDLLNATERTQPAMLAAGVATYRLWLAKGGAPARMMAGHSLGEFSALVAAGALDFRTAIDLVRYRAEAMQRAVPAGVGAMAAILGLDDAEVVEPVNYNAPGQIVIAGHASAVGRAIEAAKARGAKRAIALPVSVPSHSSLMLPAAEALRARLADTAVTMPNGIAVYGVDVAIHATPAAIRAGLVKQLHTPVRWAATLRAMIAAGARQIVECGPGKVLTGLNRRIDKNKDLAMLALEDEKSLTDALQVLV
jgi:[acyl-carrier-protein] S-malonyltransferase